jgi:hypothetical protein
VTLRFLFEVTHALHLQGDLQEAIVVPPCIVRSANDTMTACGNLCDTDVTDRCVFNLSTERSIRLSVGTQSAEQLMKKPLRSPVAKISGYPADQYSSVTFFLYGLWEVLGE